jgi:hypothetical protein
VVVRHRQHASAGAVGDTIGLVVAAMDVGFTARDPGADKIDVTVSSLDLTAPVGGAVASIADAAPKEAADGNVYAEAIRTGSDATCPQRRRLSERRARA